MRVRYRAVPTYLDSLWNIERWITQDKWEVVGGLTAKSAQQALDLFLARIQRPSAEREIEVEA